MKRIILTIFIILTSCATPQLSSKDPRIAAQNICMNSEGRGRLTINNKKYVFSYFSSLESKYSRWTLGLSFPFQDEETFELDWSENQKMKFKTSLDTKILRENSQINPEALELFITSLGNSLKDIIKLKGIDKKLTHRWWVEKNSLYGTNPNKKSKMSFTNLDTENKFGLIKFEYLNNTKQNFKIEFILKECFETKLDKEKA